MKIKMLFIVFIEHFFNGNCLLQKAFKFSKTESFRIVTIMENAFDSVLEHGTVVNCDVSMFIEIIKVSC